MEGAAPSSGHQGSCLSISRSRHRAPEGKVDKSHEKERKTSNNVLSPKAGSSMPVISFICPTNL